MELIVEVNVILLASRSGDLEVNSGIHRRIDTSLGDHSPVVLQRNSNLTGIRRQLNRDRLACCCGRLGVGIGALAHLQVNLRTLGNLGISRDALIHHDTGLKLVVPNRNHRAQLQILQVDFVACPFLGLTDKQLKEGYFSEKTDGVTDHYLTYSELVGPRDDQTIAELFDELYSKRINKSVS